MIFVRPNIEALSPYVPGEQPSANDQLKLNTNESPYSPPDSVIQALHAVSGELLRRYPPATSENFRSIAARTHGVKPEQIIATHGGDELLRLAFTVFCTPGNGSGTTSRGAAVMTPSYSLYDVLAAIQDTPLHRIELTEAFEIPAGAESRLAHSGCGLALVVNPHAPSGRRTPVQRLAALADVCPGVLLVDEAYVDFADEDALSLVTGPNAKKNVLLLRSLSKGYALAGIRFGYGIADPAIIQHLDKARDSYNLNVVSQRLAEAALEARETYRSLWTQVRKDREDLRLGLQQLGFVVFPSETNFLLATHPGGVAKTKSLFAHLKAQQIYVRYFPVPGLEDKLRITVGTAVQHQRLLAAVTRHLDVG
jgi:histidinol-phosphate aminotransferase